MDIDNLLSKVRAIAEGPHCRFLVETVDLLFQGMELSDLDSYDGSVFESMIGGSVEALGTGGLLKKTSPTKELLRIDMILREVPELGYWRQKGLTAKQILLWIISNGSTLDNIIKSLCYCRFELVDLGLEESQSIEDVLSWFSRILEKFGYYPAPLGYKSFLDKQIELENKILGDKERQLEELKKLTQRQFFLGRQLFITGMHQAFYDQMAKEGYKKKPITTDQE